MFFAALAQRHHDPQGRRYLDIISTVPHAGVPFLVMRCAGEILDKRIVTPDRDALIGHCLAAVRDTLADCYGNDGAISLIDAKVCLDKRRLAAVDGLLPVRIRQRDGRQVIVGSEPARIDAPGLLLWCRLVLVRFGLRSRDRRLGLRVLLGRSLKQRLMDFRVEQGQGRP